MTAVAPKGKPDLNQHIPNGLKFTWHQQVVVIFNALAYLLMSVLFGLAFKLSNFPDLTKLIQIDRLSVDQINRLSHQLSQVDPLPFWYFSGYTLVILLVMTVVLTYFAGASIGAARLYHETGNPIGVSDFFEQGQRYFQGLFKLLAYVCLFLLIVVALDGILMIGLGWLVSLLVAPISFGLFMVLWSLIWFTNLAFYIAITIIFFLFTFYAMACHVFQPDSAKAVTRATWRFVRVHVGGTFGTFFVGLLLQVTPGVLVMIVFTLLGSGWLLARLQLLALSYIAGFATTFWLIAPYFHFAELSKNQQTDTAERSEPSHPGTEG